MAGICFGNTVAAAEGPEHWQSVAVRDLDAARTLIEQVHPLAIDPEHPELRDWIDRGHREAMSLIPEVFNYDSMVAVVHYYISGFQDGHLVYSDNIRPKDAQMHTVGWRVALLKGKARVVAVADQWPTPLPPKGSELISCDGVAAQALVDERVAPFFDRRPFAAARANLYGSLGLLVQKNNPLRRCDFITPSGEQQSVEATYQPLTPREYWETLITPSQVERRRGGNSFSLIDGVLWVRAGSFSLSPDEVSDLHRLLKDLGSINNAKAIVFDARGNGGGDSGFGDEIFKAATGGLEFDETDLDTLPRTHALWRVSNVSIKSAERFVERREGQYGEGSEELRYAQDHLERLLKAKESGEQWMEQPGGVRVDRSEVAKRGGKLARFGGRVLLLTDSSCASACLDFADQVLLTPGSIHAGQETSGDAIYIDSTFEHLPSGNGFVIPLKVWRNRLRGNNETLVPDVQIDLDQEEDLVRKLVLRALDVGTP